MHKLSRLQRVRVCFLLLSAACTLDSTPRSQRASQDARQEGWQPQSTTGRPGADAEAGPDATAPDSSRDEPARAAGGSGSSRAGNAASAPFDDTPGQSMQSGGTGAPAVDMNMNAGMSTPAADSGTAGASGVTGAAGSAGADAGSDNNRQSLIDAAIEALGGGGTEPWRSGGQDGGGLSADFVKSVLFSMVASGRCFREVQRCVQMCIVISRDCKPCSEDAECAEALRTVCGPFGTCEP